MIRLDDVTFRYADAGPAVLKHVDLHLPEGELVLVAGPTGSGKSTLLGLLNGMVPHFTGGTLNGDVVVDGRSIADCRPRDLAAVVGRVGQDPVAGFVADTVEEELAYGMEQLGVPPATMRQRVEETLDLLGIADLRHRTLRLLSGGQQQRVSIGAVLAAGARVLVLDEPTSALDPAGADDVLASITRLVHDLGVTAVVAEHRMERVLQYADRLVLIDGFGAVSSGSPRTTIAKSANVPPVVELSVLAGWQPPAISVREARGMVGLLRDAVGDPPTAERGEFGPGLVARGIAVRYGGIDAVDDVSLSVGAGEVVALMGRNGSGKSSLLWALTEHGRRDAGTIHLGDEPAGGFAVALVPQSPADLLYLDSVDAECTEADAANGVVPGSTRTVLDRLAPGIVASSHPRDLSEGQRLALALAVQLVGSPNSSAGSLVLLDEPTRGLDYRAKHRLRELLLGLTAGGAAVLVATHDVEFAALCADRVVVLADGEVVADGPADAVLTANPAFAPQVAKVLHPRRWLTVEQVRAALPVRT